MTERQDQIRFRVIQTCFFLTGALCISIKGGYSYAPAVLLLLSLPIIIKRGTYSALNRDSKLHLMIIVLYVLVQVISILLDGGGIKDFDRPSRALLGAAVFILCLRYPPRFSWLMAGISIGATGAGIRAVFNRFVSGDGRAFESMNAIQGGNISMTLGLLSLCGVMWSIKRSRYLHTFFFAIATIMGVVGSILSKTRGGWILVPVILFIIYRIYSDWFSKRLKLGMLLTSSLLIIFCLTPQSTIPKRFKEIGQDIRLYSAGDKKDTSTGHRLELWKSSLDSFVQKPLFGWGNQGVKASRDQQFINGSLSKETYDFNSHAHNQYLDEMAKRGAIGLTALLALFLFPLYLFEKGLKESENPESRTFAACGVVLVLSMMGYCLTQSFLNHNSGIVFYSIFTAYFISATSPATTKNGFLNLSSLEK